MAKRKRAPKRLRKSPILFDLLCKRQDKVLHVLDKHGVYFDAGTYITLASPLERVAAYHAVPDLGRFLKDLKNAVKPGRGRG